ncbi:helicase-related protein [Endozoicomonas acroporae]|uniref:helicase-related protein n=1 Tax=Endozoicomonas acroporae TaxID=1701104 RepID=UPI0013D61BAC|nr:helicase-related protein [Endozoicomonas acroporae]
MLKLEDLKKDALIRGIEGDDVVSIIAAEMSGDSSASIIYKNSKGGLGERMLFRDDEPHLELASVNRPWTFDANGSDFKLGLEAYRISQSALFDPMMAVHTSNVEPLPHQISAVYESMLPRQPLRYVLADDPGAGKTIMAGLLIRELLMRADARRVLVVAPGSLTEQWQDELLEKFSTRFEIFSKEKQEQCATGNFFEETDLLICRVDQLSRNEDYQEKLKTTEWDLIIVDEAHKLSVNYFSGKVNETKRFKLGKLLGSITRHFLLMTATPHNGKEEDFQTWLSLLDGDRFYGKFREGVHKVDVTDLMRRMVKEDLLKFDGTLLFPERRAYTANYDLSPMEASLYEDVTDYVRHEMNRADNLDGKRKGTVGFALTQLQRRLASSPEAIYQSLKRRKKRLEDRLEEMKLIARGQPVSGSQVAETLAQYKVADFDEADDDLNADEYEALVEEVIDQATASATIPELEAEICILQGLEKSALALVRSQNDRKWEELSNLLQNQPEMYNRSGSLRKMIIFTEHKDTLNYLTARIRTLLGREEAVDVIHGGVNRDARRKVQEEFRNNKELIVLIATDAAGEGVNLQNANLMVNYDLPWNPNRLEQRFGRIHRIGQTEVCHLWNIVANDTREGDVFRKLFDKLEVEKAALGGRVFDILGEAFDNISLKDLLVEAIRYGEQPEVKARLSQAIEGALDTEHLKAIIERNALVPQCMDIDQLYSIKEEMEKAEARKLQPYFIRSFFSESFKSLGGEMRSRESGRFEIRHVPAVIRERDRVIGESRTPALKKYERICFDKEHIRLEDKAMADLIHPAHPLMHATTDLVLSAHRSKLKQGAVLIDPKDESQEPRLLFIIDHSIREGSGEKAITVSRRLQFVTINEHGQTESAGWAPHLAMEPVSHEDLPLIQDAVDASWINQNLEALALTYAAQQLVPEHYQEVKARRLRHTEKVMDAVKSRLSKEINYWADRYIQLKNDLKVGKQPRMQPENARRRHDEISARLQARMQELEAQKQIISNTPVVIGGALLIPQGLLDQRNGKTTFSVDAQARKRIELMAMEAVIRAEEALGHRVKDVSAEKCGWDITAIPPLNADGSIPPKRHIEVKGRAKGQEKITVTSNEIKSALNQKDKFILAVVIVDGDQYDGPYYIRNLFNQEPGFAVSSVDYNLNQLLPRSITPEQSV